MIKPSRFVEEADAHSLTADAKGIIDKYRDGPMHLRSLLLYSFYSDMFIANEDPL